MLFAAKPDIPWKLIMGMRNHIAHVYFDINADSCTMSSQTTFRLFPTPSRTSKRISSTLFHQKNNGVAHKPCVSHPVIRFANLQGRKDAVRFRGKVEETVFSFI